MTQTPGPYDGDRYGRPDHPAEQPEPGQAPSYGPATDYGQAPASPPPYGYDPARSHDPARSYDPASGYEPTTQLAPADERTWGLLSHLSVLIAGFVSAFILGWLGPLLIMLIQGPKSPYVRHHAVEALNFFISLTIYFLISAILAFLIIGIPMLAAVFVAGIVFPIIASVKANAGEYYRYPLTIRLIR